MNEEVKELNDAEIRRENDLIRLVRLGNRQAFTELVELYQQKVFKLAYGFLRDRDDAMEIVQETFLRVYQKLDSFKAGDSGNTFKNWVYRIAYNLCIDFYRKYRKKKADDRDLYELAESSETNPGSPENQLDRQHFKHTLEKCVMDLSKRQKKIFALKHYSGLKYREISDVLDISVGTAKSLYHRAVKNLEKRLLRLEATK